MDWRYNIKESFSDLAVVSKAKNSSIKDLVAIEGEVGNCVASWNFKFRRNLMEREMPNLIVLLQLLEHIRLLNILEDIRLWKPDPSGIFSCKSTFNWFTSDQNFGDLFWTKTLWKSTCPIKVKVFGWLVALGKINVHPMMQKRRPFICLSPGWCVCCKKSNEEVAHLFLGCCLAQRLWIKLLNAFEIQWVLPGSVPLMMVSKVGGRKGRSYLWRTAVLAIIWVIWLERNNRIFEGIEASVEDLWEKVRFWTAVWVYKTKSFEQFSFLDLNRDWRLLCNVAS
ncbi:uncharacterized protein LOC115699905 [Cannabis sativa]|uniref:uncharacterized protein LOC115699905 n=1 Tax=Cannabis sativa TaxID=3483 RepID=UPI0029CA1BCE|nr:uncharacterized protein LOC115699905 [Cannabis sativa]